MSALHLSFAPAALARPPLLSVGRGRFGVAVGWCAPLDSERDDVLPALAIVLSSRRRLVGRAAVSRLGGASGKCGWASRWCWRSRAGPFFRISGGSRRINICGSSRRSRCSAYCCCSGKKSTARDCGSASAARSSNRSSSSNCSSCFSWRRIWPRCPTSSRPRGLGRCKPTQVSRTAVPRLGRVDGDSRGAARPRNGDAVAGDIRNVALRRNPALGYRRGRRRRICRGRILGGAALRLRARANRGVAQSVFGSARRRIPIVAGVLRDGVGRTVRNGLPVGPSRRLFRTSRPTTCTPRSPKSSAGSARSSCCCSFLGLVRRIFAVGLQQPDLYAKLLAVGLAATLGFQVFVIVGGVIGIFPLTGITLPFVSVRRKFAGGKLLAGLARVVDERAPAMIARTYAAMLSVVLVAGCAHGGRSSAPSEAPGSSSDGGALYLTHCASCHQADGRGMSGVFPPLAGDRAVIGDPGERSRRSRSARAAIREPAGRRTTA